MSPTHRYRRFSSVPIRQAWRRAVAVLASVGLVLGLAVVSGLGNGVANAALPTGITGYDVLLNGEPLTAGADIKDSDTLTLRLRYSTAAKGQTVAFEPVAGLGTITVANPDIHGVPTGNTAIQSVTTPGGVLTIKFKDAAQWPGGVVNGIFGLNLDVSTVTTSGSVDLKWKIGPEEQTFTLTVLKAGDKRADVKDGYEKTSNYTQSDLNRYVKVDGAALPGSEVSFQSVGGKHITDEVIEYTLVLHSAGKRDNYSIVDQLPAGMEYVTAVGGALDVVSAKLTTWDLAGLNMATEDITTFAPTITPAANYATAGDKFAGTVNVPGTTVGYGDRNPNGPSTLIIKYKAKIKDPAKLLADLQAAYTAKKASAGGEQQDFSATLVNTATFGSGATAKTDTATVKVEGKVPGITPGSAFGKDSNWTTDYVVEDAAHVLNREPQITYSITAKLASLQGSSGSNPITQNVVIRDELRTQAAWDTADLAFISVTGTLDGVAITTLPALCPATPSVANMAGDAYKGKYCVDGQTLYVNVGKDTATDVTIKAKAKITAVNGLAERTPTADYTKIEGAKAYLLPNTAQFYYKDSTNHYDRTKNVTIVALPASGSTGGLDDSDVFAKNGPSKEVQTDPGKSVLVPFTFTVNTAKGIDPETGAALNSGDGIDPKTTTIVDHVDTTVFDISDLTKVEISGKYDSTTLDGADFDVTRSGSDLLITIKAASHAKITPVGKKWTVTVELPTKVFDGKQTFAVTNSATLEGVGSKKLYISETTASATSFGDEAEVRKTVYNAATGTWVKSIDIPAADAATHTYVFGIDYIPHGAFDKTLIDPVLDKLPAALKFCGFVSAPSDVVDCDHPATSPKDMGATAGGHVWATWDSGSTTVTIDDDGSNMLASKGPFRAMFAVKVTDTAAAVVNKLTTNNNDPVDEARIVPKKPSTGGGGGGATTSPTPTVTTTPTTAVTTKTTAPSTTPTIPTVAPTSGTGATTPPPPTNVPGITTTVPEPNQCVDLVEHGFVPGETVTITITGPDGQYTITAVADENGDVAFCLKSAVPVRVTIEVLGENHVVVREVALGIGGELPNTGVPTATYLTWALLLLGAGAALVLVGRRGRKGKHITQ